MAEGLIELSMIREHRKVSRYLTVVKMERRKISSEAVPFAIDRRRGIVFQVSRLRTTLLRRPEKEPGTVPVPATNEGTTIKPRNREKGILSRLRGVSGKLWHSAPSGLKGPGTSSHVR